MKTLIPLLLLLNTSVYPRAQPPVIQTCYTINIETAPDTLYLDYRDKLYGDPLLDRSNKNFELRAIRSKDGNFHFSTHKIQHNGYISLYTRGDVSTMMLPQYLLYLYLVTPGDSIGIHFNQDTSSTISKTSFEWNYDAFSYLYRNRHLALSFDGNSPAKYRCRYKIDSAAANDRSSSFITDNKGNHLEGGWFEKAPSISRSILNEFKNSLSTETYQLLLCNLYCQFNSYKFSSLSNAYQYDPMYMGMKKDSVFNKNILCAYQTRYAPDIDSVNQFDADILRNSTWYSSFIIESSFFKARLSNKNTLETVFYTIAADSTILYKPGVLGTFIKKYYRSLSSPDNLIGYFKSLYPDRSDILNNIQLLNQELTRGATAYNFSLKDIQGKMHSLEELRGKVVFMDFWFTGCGACKDFYKKSLSFAEDTLKGNSQVIFVSVSIDTDPKIWKKSLASGEYSSNFALNLTTGDSGVTHPIIAYYRIMGYPFPIIIDPDGNIYTTSLPRRDKEYIIGLIKKALVKE